MEKKAFQNSPTDSINSNNNNCSLYTMYKWTSTVIVWLLCVPVSVWVLLYLASLKELSPESVSKKKTKSEETKYKGGCGRRERKICGGGHENAQVNLSQVAAAV